MPAPKFLTAIAISFAIPVLLSACADAPPTTPPVSPADALDALNVQARANYAASRTVLLERQRPAIIVEFDDAVLLRDKAEPLRASFTPLLYHRYKQVVHLPLGLWATLAPWVDRPQSTDWQVPLRALMQRGEAARATLEQVGFPADRIARQRQIIELSLAFGSETLDRGTVDAGALRTWSRRIMPLAMANSDDAAALQIDGLHEVVSKWRRELLTPQEWQRVRVMVLGPRMPRADNLSIQYFQRVMGRAELERRLVYAEGIFNVAAASQLLGTIAIDRRLAIDFFGAEMRMDRDVLADGARKRLDAIFGPEQR